MSRYNLIPSTITYQKKQIMITINTDLKHIVNSFEELKKLGVDIDLNTILTKDFESGLPIDISCPL